MRYFLFPLMVLAAILVGCEGNFVGERAENSELINGPFQIKIQSIGGTNYLVVLNTNYRFQAAHGNIQFYTLTDPRNPVKATNLNSVSIPTNVGDFEIVDLGTVTRLFVLNRTRDELWVYRLSGANFERERSSANIELALLTGSNATRIVPLTSSLIGGRTALAIVMQRAGTVALFDPSNLTYIEYPSVAAGTDRDSGRLQRGDIPTAGFYMTPRAEGQRIGVGSLRQLGYGMTGGVSLGGADELFAGFNAFENAVYVFRFRTFRNTANFTWDLRAFRGDTNVGGVVRRGTGENGFRGIDVDDAGNLFLANRADNYIYRIPASALQEEKTSDSVRSNRNTTAFERDLTNYRYDITLDPDITDEVFPRLGSLAVDRTGGAATVLWVLGLGKGKTGEEGKIYRIDLTTPILTHTKTLGLSPQKLLYYKVGAQETLYAVNTKSDSLVVLDPTNLDILKTISN